MIYEIPKRSEDTISAYIRKRYNVTYGVAVEEKKVDTGLGLTGPCESDSAVAKSDAIINKLSKVIIKPAML